MTLPNLVDARVNDWIPTLDKVLNQYAAAKFIPAMATSPKPRN